MVFKNCVFGLVALSMLGGCVSMTPDYRGIGRKLNGLSSEALGDASMTESRFDERDRRPDTDARALRRDFIRGMVSASNEDCEDYMIGVSASANQVRGSLGFAGLSFAAAGSIATPERSSRLLNALGALTGSTVTSLEDTVFNGRDFQIIYAAVQTGRRADRDRIYADLETGRFDTWGYLSLRDLILPIHLNCGINYGLQQIAEAVEAQARQSAPASPQTPTQSAAENGSSTDQIPPAILPTQTRQLAPSPR